MSGGGAHHLRCDPSRATSHPSPPQESRGSPAAQGRGRVDHADPDGEARSSPWLSKSATKPPQPPAASSPDPKGAIDLFHHAIEICPEDRLRDRFMYHAHLLRTLVDLEDWDEVAEATERATPFLGDVTCGRVVALLRDSISRVDGADGVPLSVRDGVRHLDRRLAEAGYPTPT